MRYLRASTIRVMARKTSVAPTRIHVVLRSSEPRGQGPCGSGAGERLRPARSGIVGLGGLGRQRRERSRGDDRGHGHHQVADRDHPGAGRRRPGARICSHRALLHSATGRLANEWGAGPPRSAAGLPARSQVAGCSRPPSHSGRSDSCLRVRDDLPAARLDAVVRSGLPTGTGAWPRWCRIGAARQNVPAWRLPSCRTARRHDGPVVGVWRGLSSARQLPLGVLSGPVTTADGIFTPPRLNEEGPPGAAPPQSLPCPYEK